jgi:hypothetical protein
VLLLLLQVLRATHAHDLERLAEAELRLKDELAAKAARDAKAEEEAEEAAAEKALQARQLAAAITIQAAWRGFKVRRCQCESSSTPAGQQAETPDPCIMNAGCMQGCARASV